MKKNNLERVAEGDASKLTPAFTIHIKPLPSLDFTIFVFYVVKTNVERNVGDLEKKSHP